MQTSASVSEDWLLPKSAVRAWQQIPCWKEPQRLVKHDIVPHCTGNRMGCFGCVVGFSFSLGLLWVCGFGFFDNARFQDECFMPPGSLPYWNF